MSTMNASSAALGFLVAVEFLAFVHGFVGVQLYSFSPRQQGSRVTTPTAVPIRHPPHQDTKLYGVRAFFKSRFGSNGEQDDEMEEPDTAGGTGAQIQITDLGPPDISSSASPTASSKGGSRVVEQVDICIIGGGVSGLVAATEAVSCSKNKRVLLLEASPTLGGRVQSDVTSDGFILDRGFAVFIEKYPFAQKLLDYNKLQLSKFLPGALIKLPHQEELALVTNPLRQPNQLLPALLAPVGSLLDKLKVLPLMYHCMSSSIPELFEEEEATTMQALQERWRFSNSSSMLETFYKPFLQGIYLTDLENQSSRMFHFVFKMFSEGSAMLPRGGMGAVASQLVSKAKEAGVEVRTNVPVQRLQQQQSKVDNVTDHSFLIHTSSKNPIRTKCVIVATDGAVAQQLLSGVEGLGLLKRQPQQPQRTVGCLYYSFDGPAPILDPLLILNGMSDDSKNIKASNPVNNVCFPSQVCTSYAPEGKGLCSVTVLEPAMKLYEGRETELDKAVRTQLATWFPAAAAGIETGWKLEKMYCIPNAQPSQLSGPVPANVNGGRNCNTYRGTQLPKGLLVCGDHMATATLNGALESGYRCGRKAATLFS